MSDDVQDRAERLAGRWGGDEDDEPADGPIERDGEFDVEIEERDGGERPDESSDELTTREMQSQMLYLPPEFHRELDLTYEELNLKFRRERDRRVEKNKDFFVGLLELGMEQLGDVHERDVEEIESLLGLDSRDDREMDR